MPIVCAGRIEQQPTESGTHVVAFAIVTPSPSPLPAVAQLHLSSAPPARRNRLPTGQHSMTNAEYKRRSRAREGARINARDRAAKRRWREANRERGRLASQLSRAARIEDYREAERAWKRAHPDRVCEYSARRRAMQRGAFVEHVDRDVVLIRDRGICGICGDAVGPDWHLDHVIPLARGGEHSYANTQVSHPRCNVAKGAA